MTSQGKISILNVNRNDSFQHLVDWLKDIKGGTIKNSTICIVGNKSDMKEERTVSYNEAAKFCQDNGKYFLISV